MNTPILNWHAAAAAGPARAGGKGWQLGTLAALGFPIPPGFVIDSNAATGRRAGDPLPDSIANAIAQELQNRGWQEQPLAVRSSASAEDSANASFAGIHRSCLNVRGIDATVRAVQAVWDSPWAPTAAAYRERLGIKADNVAMATVIMPLLPAVASGIAFTCDPASGRADLIIIHAHWGLGESLVSGQAEGDEYCLQRDALDHSLRLITQRAGNKTRMSVPLPEGDTALQETPANLRQQPVLNPEQAISLGKLATEVALALDYTNPRYDIEWAWNGTRFWILQARPVTARSRYTYEPLRDQPTFWSRANARDVVPDPLSALEADLWQNMWSHMATWVLKLVGYPILPGLQLVSFRQGRVYWNMSILQWHAFDAFGAAPKVVNTISGGEQPEIVVPKPTLRERLSRARNILLYALRIGKLRRQANTKLTEAHERARQWVSAPLPTNDAERARLLREQLTTLRQAKELFMLQASTSAVVALTDFVEKHNPGQGQALTASLMGTGTPTVTALQGYELMELAQIASSDAFALTWLRRQDRAGSEWSSKLPDNSPFRSAFAQFLERYGHRSIYESYLRSPRWREDPSYLLDSIVSFMGCDPSLVRTRQTHAFAEARKRVLRSLPIWQRPLFQKLIQMAITERNQREAARSALMAYFDAIRRTALVLGNRHTDLNGLQQPDDVFHLTSLELLDLADSRLPVTVAAARAKRRREQVEHWALQTEPEVVIEDGEAVSQVTAPATTVHGSNEDSWHGTGVAAGKAQGTAHIALHPSEALNIRAGSILVAPSTDPAWTPLFLKAGAVIMETGGYLSHGAIVAREFGVPAVAGLPGILKALSTGDELEVDGDRGTIRRLRRGALNLIESQTA